VSKILNKIIEAQMKECEAAIMKQLWLNALAALVLAKSMPNYNNYKKQTYNKPDL
jgi:hypothetical protein